MAVKLEEIIQLGGAYLILDSLKWSKSGGKVHFSIAYPDWDNQEVVKKNVWRRISKIPLIGGKVTLYGVDNLSMGQPQVDNRYFAIDDAIKQDHKLEFRLSYGLDIVIQVNSGYRFECNLENGRVGHYLLSENMLGIQSQSDKNLKITGP